MYEYVIVTHIESYCTVTQFHFDHQTCQLGKVEKKITPKAPLRLVGLTDVENEREVYFQ